MECGDRKPGVGCVGKFIVGATENIGGMTLTGLTMKPDSEVILPAGERVTFAR